MVRALLLISIFHHIALPAVDGGRHVVPEGHVANGGESLLPDAPAPTGELSRKEFPSDKIPEADIGLSPPEAASLVSDTGSSDTAWPHRRRRSGRRRQRRAPPRNPSTTRTDLTPSGVSTLSGFVPNAERPERFVDSQYIRLERACVSGHDISAPVAPETEGVTGALDDLQQCMNRCNNRQDCLSFEYGRNGEHRHWCSMQNSIDAQGCDGADSHDLYIKQQHIDNRYYTHYPGGCVDGHNIELIHDTPIGECQARCDAHPACEGFEYGTDWGGRYGEDGHQANDCHLQSGSNIIDCNGYEWNWDFYRKAGSSNLVCEGDWKRLTTISPSGSTLGITVGISQSQSSSVTTDVRTTMETSVEAGVVTSGVSVEVGIAVELARSTDFHSDTNWTQTVTPSRNGADQLWQWVYRFEGLNDASGHQVEMCTRHLAVTRVGEEPACLPSRFAHMSEADCPLPDQATHCTSGQFHGGTECIRGGDIHRR